MFNCSDGHVAIWFSASPSGSGRHAQYMNEVLEVAHPSIRCTALLTPGFGLVAVNCLGAGDTQPTFLSLWPSRLAAVKITYRLALQRRLLTLLLASPTQGLAPATPNSPAD